MRADQPTPRANESVSELEGLARLAATDSPLTEANSSRTVNTLQTPPTTTTKYYYFGAQRVAMRNASGVADLHGDHLGSTSATSGVSNSTQVYYPFGGVRATIGNVPTDFTYTGQRIDASANLMYYGARYYDSATGRFTQPDTIVPNLYNPQSLNRYAYVLNNPVKYTDPTGNKECGLDNPCDAEEVRESADTRKSLIERLSDYGVRVEGRFQVTELRDILFAMDAIAHDIGKERLVTLLREGNRHSETLTFSRIGKESNTGWIDKSGKVTFSDWSFDPKGPYRWDRLFNPDEPSTVAYWYTGHEVGHILVDGMRVEGIDLAILYEAGIRGNPLHGGPSNEDVATAIALGALENKGISLRQGFNPVRDFANDVLREWLKRSVSHGPD